MSVVKRSLPFTRSLVVFVLPIISLAGFALGGCRSLENAAAKDPVKCERDPNCTKRSEKSRDCSTQCADNPDCMKRCEMIQGGVDRGR
jgi:hypothetical protein